jgi:hypothetical protein
MMAAGGAMLYFGWSDGQARQDHGALSPARADARTGSRWFIGARGRF